jgi:hypothetical protein
MKFNVVLRIFSVVVFLFNAFITYKWF